MRSSRPMNRPAGVLSVAECVVDLYANRKLAISSLCVMGKDWISRSSALYAESSSLGVDGKGSLDSPQPLHFSLTERT